VKNYKTVLIALIILTTVASGFLFPAEGAPQVQYLSAVEIYSFIKKYIDERPVTEVIDELGEPTTEPTALIGEVGLATWYIMKNRFSIVMMSRDT
jgi:hypothetical protein